MTSTDDMQERASSPDLLAMLNRVYARRGIQRDVFGRRPALPSEISHALARNATLSAWQSGRDAVPAPTFPFTPLGRAE